MARCVFARCANPPTVTAPLAIPDSPMPLHVPVCTEHRLAIAHVTQDSMANDTYAEPPMEEWQRLTA